MPTPRPSTPLLLLFALASWHAGSVELAAQAPDDPATTAEAPSLAELLERLRSAHAPRTEAGEPADPVRADRFRARLVVGRIGSAGSAADDGANVDVELQVEFIRPRLIRYAIEEKGKRFERGRDEDGVWTAREGKVFDLSEGDARTFADEEAALMQHLRLANQLVRFLDPAEEIARLENVEGPVAGRLPFRSMRDREFWIVEGTSGSFPTYFAGGVGRRTRLRLWIDRTEARLTAIEARPLAEAAPPPMPADWPGGKDGGKDEASTAGPDDRPGADEVLPGGEFILLEDLQRGDEGGEEGRNGPLVPRTLRIRELDATGRPQRGGVQVRINRLELDPPDLVAASMRRPRQ
jgi:hypothetical protein